MSQTPPNYPGARWWKFDFHTHTPASKDWRGGAITPREWLLTFMAAGVDCVVVTDHDSGAWIDLLKEANAELEVDDLFGNPPAGYRKLVIFPGVEISAGPVHILAVFDPTCATRDIDRLLGAVGHAGGPEDVATKSLLEVIAAIFVTHALPIAAHADCDKGLFQCEFDATNQTFTNKSVVNSTTINQIINADGC